MRHLLFKQGPFCHQILGEYKFYLRYYQRICSICMYCSESLGGSSVYLLINSNDAVKMVSWSLTSSSLTWWNICRELLLEYIWERGFKNTFKNDIINKVRYLALDINVCYRHKCIGFIFQWEIKYIEVHYHQWLLNCSSNKGEAYWD